ncbi:uncharacterized protein LOC141695539 [Apium graveolens]|uniref:uncharacterized protein LOC141695539 n=1 Tax=Apium graveolens TaxID=4045 RepID=UPI003D7A038E
MFLILRYVNVSSNPIQVEEYFVEFLKVDDTSGLGLSSVLENALVTLDLDIDNIRGQGYDNGSNMKGKHQGVQKRLLDINPRAFYTPCGCHSLNLALCDIANSCVKAKDFFGIIQGIYNLFSNSTKRWKILKEHIKISVEPLSSTRWENHLEVVKAIRFQPIEIREALLELAETDGDNDVRCRANILACFYIGNFEFLVGLIIWYEILHAVNLISKYLQSSDMLNDVAIDEIQGLINLFKEYRETGFMDAIKIAKDI